VPGVVVQRVIVLVQPGFEPLDVGGATYPIADRVELELVAGDAEPPQ
jgi:hypothetical protein